MPLTSNQALFATLGFWVVMYFVDKYTDSVFNKERNKVIQGALLFAQWALFLAALFWFNTSVLGEQATLSQWASDLVLSLATLGVLCAIAVAAVNAIDKRGDEQQKAMSGYILWFACGLWLLFVGQGWFYRG